MSGDLDANLASARVEEAAADRRRARRSVDAAAAATSWVDVLDGLCERGDLVTVSTALPAAEVRRVRGRVEEVGADAVAVAVSTGTGTTTIVAFDAIVGVRVHTDESTTRGIGATAWVTSPTPAQGIRKHMADMLSQRATGHTRISTWAGSEQWNGRVLSIGTDVVAVELDGRGAIAYVRLDSTTAISVSSLSDSSSE